MKPLAELRPAGPIRGLFFDIDDTLTTAGVLTAGAYGALERLCDAGLTVVPITGRPAGWCDHIARMWPVDGVVGENGAFYFCYDRAAGRLVKRFRDDDATRAANRARLAAVGDRILRAVRGTALASDQAYREADLAIDFCEDVPRLADAAIDRIVAIMRESGLTAKVSSIHVNGWFGDYDKLGMTKTFMRRALRRRSRRAACVVCLRRRLAERCADVRVLFALGRGGQRPRRRASDRASASVRDRGGERCGLRRAYRAAARVAPRIAAVPDAAVWLLSGLAALVHRGRLPAASTRGG